MESPGVSKFHPQTFLNLKTGLPYSLHRADSLNPGPEVLETIRKCCNEPEIYEFLFRVPLSGVPYSLEKAKGFLEWAAKGWRESSYFVFVVLDQQNNVVGALDIKSNNEISAEIGYWGSSIHAGVISPALGCLCGQARLVGFRSLFAYVKTNNLRSIAVLERNGFHRVPVEDFSKGYPRFRFELQL